jgi:hypothetical protein
MSNTSFANVLGKRRKPAPAVSMPRRALSSCEFGCFIDENPILWIARQHWGLQVEPNPLSATSSYGKLYGATHPEHAERFLVKVIDIQGEEEKTFMKSVREEMERAKQYGESGIGPVVYASAIGRSSPEKTLQAGILMKRYDGTLVELAGSGRLVEFDACFDSLKGLIEEVAGQSMLFLDLKPENIVLNLDHNTCTEIRLIDFDPQFFLRYKSVSEEASRLLEEAQRKWDATLIQRAYTKQALYESQAIQAAKFVMLCILIFAIPPGHVLQTMLRDRLEKEVVNLRQKAGGDWERLMIDMLTAHPDTVTPVGGDNSCRVEWTPLDMIMHYGLPHYKTLTKGEVLRRILSLGVNASTSTST